MLVKLGGGILDLRGSIGSITYARNRYGHYGRARTTPADPATALQLASRSRLGTAATVWSTVLSHVERQQWRAYADANPRTNRLGQSITLSGFAAFCGYRSYRFILGLGTSRTPPPDLHPPRVDTTFRVTVTSAGVMIIVFDTSLPWVSDDFSALGIHATPGFSAGRTFIAGPFRWAGQITGSSSSPPTSPHVTIPYPFPVAAAQNVRVYARISDRAGGLSAQMFASATVTA